MELTKLAFITKSWTFLTGVYALRSIRVLITVIGIKNKYESASLLFKVVSTTDHI